MQLWFSKSLLFSGLLLATPILGVHAWSRAQPNRVERPDAVVTGSAVEVGPSEKGHDQHLPFRAWRLAAAEPRFGGLSGLALDQDRLVALTDSGVVIRFDAPSRPRQRLAFAFHDLPDGPGPVQRKRGRDSEALLADPGGRGWWVAFEGRHSLWRFDRGFTRAIERNWLSVAWSSNKGGEAVVTAPRGALLVLPEKGGAAVEVGGKARAGLGVPRGISDATRLADGRLVLLVRQLTPLGFRSEVRIAALGSQPAMTIALPLGPLDNPEAIATAPLANGEARLWIATDDNFRPWMRTLLIALELPSSS